MTEKIKRNSGGMPGPGMMGTVQKSKDMKKAYQNLFQFMGKYRIGMFAAAVLSLLGSILNLVGPNKLSEVTDLIGNGLTGGGVDTPAVARICIILAVLYVLGFLLNFGQGQIMAVVSQKLTRDMRKDISKKINCLPLNYFDTHATGDTLSRVTNDVDTVGQSMNQSFSTLVSSVAMLIGSMVMMLCTNVLMAAAGIAAALAGFAAMLFILSRSQKFFIRQQEMLGCINGHVEETFSGFQVVKVFNGEKKAESEFHQQSDSLYDAAWKSQFYSGLMMPLMLFIGNLSYVIVCIVGAVLAVKGSITFGTIVAFMLYIRLFTQPLQNLSQSATALQSMAAACERVFEFLNGEEMENEDQKTSVIENLDGEDVGDVSFRHVRFGYIKDKCIIHNFTREIRAGQKIAIVGPTGAGKTTLVNLLMRFYEVNDGSICIDGTDLKNVRREDVHDYFSMVLQDTWLFEGTLRENLIYNQHDIAEEELDEVCAACGLTDLVRQLKNGYDTVLGDNTSLSQGQRQLITIARAMLKKAPLLILDEATSSVDTRTELMVQQAMDTLTAERTSFIIAHRLSTIKNADCILVMKDGDIIESGTHEELLSNRGFYADLYNSQFEAA